MNKLTNFFPGLVDPYFHNTPLYLEGDELRSKEGNKYKIIHNIPRILPEMSNYADAFGQQWNRWKKTQLDSYTQTTISAERINRCLGKELVNMLGSEKVLDVLEAGCGAGRFTEVLLGYPEQRITSIDLSSAVEANQDNCPQNEYHRIIQCDICFPPFALSLPPCPRLCCPAPLPSQPIYIMFSHHLALPRHSRKPLSSLLYTMQR